MKTTKISAEAKAKKAAYNKEYRERKKAQAPQEDWKTQDKFEKSFSHKVRLFKNLNLEITNSYCASPETLLKLERIKIENNNIIYRVRRTGRRTFFTTQEHLEAPKV